MTEHFGPGDYYVPNPVWGMVEEPRHRARERFVDVLQEEAPDAYQAFGRLVALTFRAVFDAGYDGQKLKAILEEKERTWNWLPHGYRVWLREMNPDHLEIREVVNFRGWLLQVLLRPELEAWTERPDPNHPAGTLRGNPWVAEYLFARELEKHFNAEDEERGVVKLNLPLPVLAELPIRLPSWDPTRETEDQWWQSAKEYVAAVKASAKRQGLKKTPSKQYPDEDFCLLVRFQVLGEIHKELRRKGETIKAVQARLRRTADLIGLERRTVT